MPTFHTYEEPNPSAPQDPRACTLENPADWPKSYRYIPTYDASQGIHPPAPVYQATQSQPQQIYYQYSQAPVTNGYYVNGTFVPIPTGSLSYSSYPAYCNKSYYTPNTYSSSYSSCYPQHRYQQYSRYYKPNAYQWWTAPTQSTYFSMPPCPSAAAAQAAATAAATNAALAAMPSGSTYFVGTHQAEITTQPTVFATAMGYTEPQPTQLAPYKPAAGQQFWCKELDGSWTLRTHDDIVMGEVSPGHWEKHATSGYYYWVRQMS